MALCHDVIPEKTESGIKLSASNPDDEALVCAANYFGVEFRDRRDKSAILYDTTSKVEEEVVVLETIAFTSKRKRMSVICMGKDGSIWIYMKGADTAMFPRFKTGQEVKLDKVNDHIGEYSNEGLRCLLLGYAEIDKIMFETWHTKYKAATSDMSQIEKSKKGLPNLIETLQDEIEVNMLLAGATAIEDRLQKGVPEAVEALAKAGIDIWVLTGDKEETAINIAVACNLLLPSASKDCTN